MRTWRSENFFSSSRVRLGGGGRGVSWVLVWGLWGFWGEEPGRGCWGEVREGGTVVELCGSRRGGGRGRR